MTNVIALDQPHELYYGGMDVLSYLATVQNKTLAMLKNYLSKLAGTDMATAEKPIFAAACGEMTAVYSL